MEALRAFATAPCHDHITAPQRHAAGHPLRPRGGPGKMAWLTATGSCLNPHPNAAPLPACALCWLPDRAPRGRGSSAAGTMAWGMLGAHKGLLLCGSTRWRGHNKRDRNRERGETRYTGRVGTGIPLGARGPPLTHNGVFVWVLLQSLSKQRFFLTTGGRWPLPGLSIGNPPP